jgi:hypothetical protein
MSRRRERLRRKQRIADLMALIALALTFLLAAWVLMRG